MRKPELWQALQAHRFEPKGAKTTFTEKLAATQGWTEKHSDRVIEEYRRFLYLTQVNTSQSVPSADVDKAWHLHLTYTKNYWDALCYDVLGAPLHHEPATGNEPEGQFAERYAQTRTLYAEEFGQTAPPAVWRSDREEFRHKLGVRTLAFGAVATILGFVLAWLDVANSTFVIGAGIAVMAIGVIIAIVYGVKGRKGSNDGGGGCGSGCGD